VAGLWAEAGARKKMNSAKKSNVPPPKTKTLEPQVDRLYSIDEERVVKLS
jgi:hypothetical protein